MNFRSFAIVATLVAAACRPLAAGRRRDGSRADARCAGRAQLPLCEEPRAKAIGQKAVGILVFPSIVKAGVGIGGQYGEGVLFRGGKASAYYNTAGVAGGLQIGATDRTATRCSSSARTRSSALDTAEGFEVGVGPSVVVADEGFAKSTTTTTVQDKIYAFIFNQSGAMVGIGIQGNKITKIKK